MYGLISTSLISLSILFSPITTSSESISHDDTDGLVESIESVDEYPTNDESNDKPDSFKNESESSDGDTGEHSSNSTTEGEKAIERHRKGLPKIIGEHEFNPKLTESSELDENLLYEIFLQLELLNYYAEFISSEIYDIASHTDYIQQSLYSNLVPYLTQKLNEEDSEDENIDNDELVESVIYIRDSVEYTTNLIYLVVTVFLPLICIVVLLWWFMKQFINRRF